jgi:hypothetical protein
MYAHLQAFRRAHRQGWPADHFVSPDGTRLGKWCTNQRQAHRKGILRQDRIRRLAAIRFPWRAVLRDEA